MNMTPFRFGPPEKSLYGVFHAAETRRQPTKAVLLCSPFGQEAVRIHRLYRVLAERLARAGIHTLRFDYFATGESGGQDTEGSMKTWMQDIPLAHQELRNRSRAAHITWMGARLGATLCALACANTHSPPQQLLLWEPVIDGLAYLDTLANAHAQAVAHSIWGKTIAPADVKDEVIGFGVGPELLGELKAITASDFAACRAQRTVLVGAPHLPHQEELLQALERGGASIEQVALEIAFDWTSEEALNTALVPANALQLLSNLLEKDAA